MIGEIFPRSLIRTKEFITRGLSGINFNKNSITIVKDFPMISMFSYLINLLGNHTQIIPKQILFIHKTFEKLHVYIITRS